ncbi:MAG: PorP/SprF family type IX secretion system membrane protein [Bacteroidales bacterium]|nr:PorP/SprF family type IX secretion system membrane protein [Bacteroidales bacterium]
METTINKRPIPGRYPGQVFWLFFAFILLIFILNVNAQMTPLFSQYTMNGYLINPAMAGSEGYTAISLVAREQWIGMGSYNQTPKMQALSAETRVLKNSFIARTLSIKKRRRRGSSSGRVGLGTYLFNDKNGHIDRLGMNLTYAYHINFRYAQLSFGLSGMFYQYNVNKAAFIPYSSDDMFLQSLDKAYFMPDATFGVYYRNPQVYAGLSANQLFETNLYYLFVDDNFQYHQAERNYMLLAGYQYELPAVREMTFEPSVLIKSNDYFNFQLDINTKLYLRKTYFTGVSYRTGNYGSFVVMSGLKISDFYFSYSYDYNFGTIRKFTYGSHEIVATYKFGDNARRYRWLNRY